jgi:hypothetical protein
MADKRFGTQFNRHRNTQTGLCASLKIGDTFSPLANQFMHARIAPSPPENLDAIATPLVFLLPWHCDWVV